MADTMIQEALGQIDSAGLQRPYLSKKFSLSEGEIKVAENRLGTVFPSSYRKFLSEIGSGDFEGVEFLGLIPGKLDYASRPNTLWLTKRLQESRSLPPDLFVVEDFGGDAFACLVLTQLEGDECPVVVWEVSESSERQRAAPHVLATSFGEYFLNKIRELIEDAC